MVSKTDITNVFKKLNCTENASSVTYFLKCKGEKKSFTGYEQRMILKKSD